MAAKKLPAWDQEWPEKQPDSGDPDPRGYTPHDGLDEPDAPPIGPAGASAPPANQETPGQADESAQP